ncbi:protein translocase subunit SecF [[Leptolyngbya] sp. PCC 7376]|uniref:protein translocase subunit SecF n=1 Tax=[Leptolyngbya] sp. PCC 7376 TaxID=111781 RepID=UPI001C1E7E4E|nr:protein translocase subunit SecF [[Leptolyngbya] sp. PCC 7376]
MKFKVTQQRLLWWSLSAIAMIASVIFMLVSQQQIQAPLRPSIDFVGGTKIQIALDCGVEGNCDEPINTADVQEILTAQNVGKSSVQVLGQDKTNLSIRTQKLELDQRTALQDALNNEIGVFDQETVQIDDVGPTIGRELFIQGMLALIVSFFGIIVYLSIRFKFDYALIAIAALVHDVLITTGIFSLFGLVIGLEVDSLFLVSLLTIIGFSVNDTVVIYDRIRENLDKDQAGDINQVVDLSVQQTLGRSINTTMTTLLPLVAIFLFGGATLKFFALALIIGFLLGSYSSIFLAGPLLAWWRGRNGKPPVITSDSVDVSEAA